MPKSIKARRDSHPHYRYKYVENDAVDMELFLETPLNYIFGDKLNIVGCKSIFMLLREEQKVINGKEKLKHIISLLSKIIDVNFIVLTRKFTAVDASRRRVMFSRGNVRKAADILDALNDLKSLDGDRVHHIAYENMIKPEDDTLKNIFDKMKIGFNRKIYTRSLKKKCSY